MPTPLLHSLLSETENFNEAMDDDAYNRERQRSLSPKLATTTLTPEIGSGAAELDRPKNRPMVSFNVSANVESDDVDTSHIRFEDDAAKVACSKPLPPNPNAPAPLQTAQPLNASPTPATAAAAPAPAPSVAVAPAPAALSAGAPIPAAPAPLAAGASIHGIAAAPPAAGIPAVPLPLGAGAPSIPGLPVLSPPPMMGGKNDKKKINPRIPMKNLHWDSIKNRNERNATVWKFIKDEEIEIDKDSLEKCFGKKPKKKKKKKGKKGGGDSSGGKKGKKDAPQTISLLEAKRSYNVSIGLARMRMDKEALKAAILEMDDKELNLEKINSLLNFVPTPKEQELVKAYDGDPKLLEMAEAFFYALRYIDNLQERLELWSFQISYPVIIQESTERIGI